MTTEGSAKIPAVTGYYWVRFELGITQLAWLNAETRTVLVPGSSVVLQADRVKTWLAGPVVYKEGEERDPLTAAHNLRLPLPKQESVPETEAAAAAPPPENHLGQLSCGNCRYGVPNGNASPNGDLFECRRFPPGFNPKSKSLPSIYWCGEWWPRKENTE